MASEVVTPHSHQNPCNNPGRCFPRGEVSLRGKSGREKGDSEEDPTPCL